MRGKKQPVIFADRWRTMARGIYRMMCHLPSTLPIIME